MTKNMAKDFLIKLLNLLQMHLKLIQKRAIQKTAEATDDLIGNRIADKITKVSRASPQNSSETVTNEVENIEHEREISKERYR